MIEPDSMTLAVLMWGLGVALILFLAVRGHVFGTRSLRHVLTRLVGMLTSTLVIVLAAVLTLNADYGWYTSWQDVQDAVTGAAPTIEQHTHGHPRTAQQKASALAAARVVDERADARYAQERAHFAAGLHLHPSATGTWIKVNVPGIEMKGQDIGRVMIWLPPSYGTDPTRTYPVIEAFHGMPGGTLDFARVFHLDRALRTAQARHAVRDAIIVVPQEMPDGVDTECVDGGGLTMETWLTRTVPDFVISHLRAQASAESWATLGVSAGGWCAAMSAELHPERYAGAVSLGGYFTPQFAGWDPFGSSVPARYDLITRVREHPTTQAWWVLVSGADRISGASSKKFVEAASVRGDVTQVDLPHAGHRVDVWEQTFPEVFTWLGRTLPAFAADAAGASAASGSTPPTASPSASAGKPSTPASTSPRSKSPRSKAMAASSAAGGGPTPVSHVVVPYAPHHGPLSPQPTQLVLRTRG